MGFSLIARFALSLSLLATFRVCPVSSEDADPPRPLDDDGGGLDMIVDPDGVLDAAVAPDGGAPDAASNGLSCVWSISDPRVLKEGPAGGIIPSSGKQPTLVHLGGDDSQWRIWLEDDSALWSLTFAESRPTEATRALRCDSLNLHHRWSLCRADENHLLAAGPTSTSNYPAFQIAMDSVTEVPDIQTREGYSLSMALPHIFWLDDVVMVADIADPEAHRIPWAGQGPMNFNKPSVTVNDDGLCVVASNTDRAGQLVALSGSLSGRELDSSSIVAESCSRHQLHRHPDTGRWFVMCVGTAPRRVRMLVSDDCEVWTEHDTADPALGYGVDEDPSPPSMVSLSGGGVLAAWTTGWLEEPGRIRLAEFDTVGNPVQTAEVEGDWLSRRRVALAPGATPDKFGLAWIDTVAQEATFALAECDSEAE